MRSKLHRIVVGIALSWMGSTAALQAAEPQVVWLGHAAVEYVSSKGNVYLIDPWISNPKAPKDLTFKRIDGILLTHGHFDHVGEAFDLARRYDAPIVASFELTELAKKYGVKAVMPLNPNGNVRLGTLMITAFPAVHSSSFKEGDNLVYAGAPLGFIVQEDGAAAFYHAGDTGLLADMSLIPELYSASVAFLPIGGTYTMTPKEAAVAARTLQVRTVVPIHFGTFPQLTGTPEDLKMEMKRTGVRARVEVMTPGTAVSLRDLVSVR